MIAAAEFRPHWTVVRAPLREGLQAHCTPSAGVLVVDYDLPEDLVNEVVAEADAAVAGDWDNAPHVERPRPRLRLVTT